MIVPQIFGPANNQFGLMEYNDGLNRTCVGSKSVRHKSDATLAHLQRGTEEIEGEGGEWANRFQPGSRPTTLSVAERERERPQIFLSASNVVTFARYLRACIHCYVLYGLLLARQS
jgi:hypothetical protein